MILRVAVCVLKSEQYPFLTDAEREKADTLDAYKVVVGPNAPDVTAALSCIASTLANAVDESGAPMGGIVVEAHAVSVTAAEFKGYERFFLQPPDHPGIFYVSGWTLFGIPRPRMAGAIELLAGLKASRQQPEMPSQPSFVFRRFREAERPRNCRLLCPVCGAWKEHDSVALMYSFFDGLGEVDPEKHRLGRQAAAKVSPFVEQHLVCLMSAGPAVANAGLCFLYEGDDAFDELDPGKESRD